MFEMWTNSERMAQWLPPTGMLTKFMKGEIKQGGRTFFCMEGVNGAMYARAGCLEIAKPNRIVYTQQFCDENQRTTRHPMAPTWPETMLTIVVLDAEDENRTHVTVTWEIFGEVSAAERDTVHKAKSGMTQGWTGSFDKLDGYLSERRG